MSTPSDKKNRGSWLWAAVAVVALAVGTAIVGLIVTNAIPLTGTTSAEPSKVGSETQRPTPPTEGGCDAPAGDFTTVPDDLTWEADAGVTWPTSPSLGPTSTKDGWPVCFSHSPVGAALAAVSIPFATLEHSPKDTLNFYVAESPGKQKAVSGASDTLPMNEQIEQTGLQLVGFRVDEYTADRALVRLVFSHPDAPTGFVGIPSPLAWVDGDWRAKALDDGTTGQPVPVNDGQFTRWSTPD